MKKKLISIGIPCFNEELNVIPSYQALKKVTSQIRKYHFEFIFVDNGSLDTWIFGNFICISLQVFYLDDRLKYFQ